MNFRHRFVTGLLLIILGTAGHSYGRDRNRYRDSGERRTPRDNIAQNYESATADAVSRPLWFGATVVGGAIFVVTLPISVLSKSVDKTAKTLVVKPANATFRRPLGDFSTVE